MDLIRLVRMYSGGCFRVSAFIIGESSGLR